MSEGVITGLLSIKGIGGVTGCLAGSSGEACAVLVCVTVPALLPVVPVSWTAATGFAGSARGCTKAAGAVLSGNEAAGRDDGAGDWASDCAGGADWRAKSVLGEMLSGRAGSGLLVAGTGTAGVSGNCCWNIFAIPCAFKGACTVVSGIAAAGAAMGW